MILGSLLFAENSKIINLDINSSKDIRLNQMHIVLISFDIDNVVLVYKKDKDIVTKRINDFRIVSKVPNYKIKEFYNIDEINTKAMTTEYLKMLDSLKPTIEIKIDAIKNNIQ
jgi:hypothetical protein